MTTTRAEQAAAVRYVATNYGDLHAVFVDLPVALSKEALLDAAATLEESARERPAVKTSLTPDFLRRLIAQDRELSAAASPPPWWHSHSTILRMHETKRDGGEIVASMWVPPGQSYMGKLVDPTTELPNARFIVHARTALLRRDEAIEHLLGEVERLERELAEARNPQEPSEGMAAPGTRSLSHGEQQYDCAKCGQPKGQPCRNKHGKVASEPHQHRQRAAIKSRASPSPQQPTKEALEVARKLLANVRFVDDDEDPAPAIELIADALQSERTLAADKARREAIADVERALCSLKPPLDPVGETSRVLTAIRPLAETQK